jgi:hypothetical protein
VGSNANLSHRLSFRSAPTVLVQAWQFSLPLRRALSLNCTRDLRLLQEVHDALPQQGTTEQRYLGIEVDGDRRNLWLDASSSEAFRIRASAWAWASRRSHLGLRPVRRSNRCSGQPLRWVARWGLNVRPLHHGSSRAKVETSDDGPANELVDGHAITRAPSHDHVPLRIAVASIWRHAAYPAICRLFIESVFLLFDSFNSSLTTTNTHSGCTN